MFIIVATLVFALLFVVWEKRGWHDYVFKISFFISFFFLAVWGFILLMANYNLLNHIQKLG